MSHRFAALALVLGAVLLTASGLALWIGATDLAMAQSGPRRTLPVESLPAGAHGWFALDGCVRHDLAVVVSAEGTVYKLGEPGVASDDGDRIYTPLAALADCSDDKPPSKIYALVEDAHSLDTTLQRAATLRIAPPPVPARVDGLIGLRAGDKGRAEKAARKLASEVPGVEHVPLLKKDAHPGPRWVALVTIAAGLHGLLLFALGALYLRRRALRREALLSGQIDDAEEQFFRTETLD